MEISQFEKNAFSFALWQCPENTEAQVHSEHAGLLLGRPVYLHSDGALQLGRPVHVYQEAESIAGTFGADFLPAALLSPALHAQAKYQAGFGEPLNFLFCFVLNIFLGEFFLIIFFFVPVLYSTLIHLPPLRFHCADGCWDRTQDRCKQLVHWQSDALTTRLDLNRI